MKRTRLALFVSLLSASLLSATLSFADAFLLRQVQEAASAGHRGVEYGPARHAMFGFTDNIVWQGRQGVLEAYSEIFVQGNSPEGAHYPELDDENRDGLFDSGGMNTEHVWPQSFFNRGLPMRSDLHHLLPTFVRINGLRDRHPFGPSGGPYSNTAGARCCDNGFEPPDSAKGRVARAMLYFYSRYHGQNILPREFVDSFWNSRIEVFLDWNRAFPPTQFEVERNNKIQQVQGNRNPFVDDPTLADRIGAASFAIGGRSAWSDSGFVQRAALNEIPEAAFDELN